ncbi:MAG: PIG-L family deacetylase [Microthrixaceae bacterium]
MTTIVCFHAHPDDECIATGGTMARAAAAGHRVVLVVATRGERGEPTPGVLTEDESLWERRIAETYEAARLLGVQRVEFLGYVDSGMMGEPSNDSPYSFWTASVDHAASRLAAILTEERADVLTIYDDHGGYGHPDHIQVHRVGLRAAELSGTGRVLQSTMNRDQIRRSIELYQEADPEAEPDAAVAARAERLAELDSFGTPEAQITHAIDVADLVGLKRDAMLAHRSQIADDSWFLMMSPESFVQAFGTEWFIETGVARAEDAPMATSLWERA